MTTEELKSEITKLSEDLSLRIRQFEEATSFRVCEMEAVRGYLFGPPSSEVTEVKLTIR